MGVEGSLELLFMQPFEEGLCYAIRNDARQSSGGGDGTPGGPLIELKARWQPGFRAIIGYSPSFTSRVAWTSFHGNSSATSTSSLSLPGVGLQSTWYPVIDSSVLYSSARFHWKLSFDSIDLEGGKRYEVSPYLAFNPVCYVRFLRLNQSFQALYGSADSVDAVNHFGGIGPGFAIGSTWSFANGLSILYGSSFSLLYGKFDTNFQLNGTTTPMNTLLSGIQQAFYRLVPTAQLEAGLGYSRCIAKGRWQIGGRLCYEALYFWGQNALRSPLGSDAPALAIQQVRDLSIQGFSLKGVFAF